jgi:Mrp family chromosome partitioning ATPase
LAYLVDMADRSFRSPDELRAELGLPVIGHIPLLIPDKRTQLRIEREAAKLHLDPVLSAHFHATGQLAEAYRAVRTSIYFSTRGEDHKVIQVTSPEPRDGKSTLAANLSVSIAHSGKRVLLVEADFRRPTQHKIFGIESSVGISSVIAGTAEIVEATCKTPIRYLWVMPCGPRPNNPSELLTSPTFKELLTSSASSTIS